MHLALQPLYVLQTAVFQILLGNGWLAGKVLAALQLFAYCAGMTLVIGYSNWKDWQKAVVLVGTFGLIIYLNFYRFDDYHITTECFQIYSIYLLLRLHERTTVRLPFGVLVILGILSGLATANRLNDGTALLLGVVIAAMFLVRSGRMLSAAIICSVATVTLLAVVLATGDTIHNWVAYSIVGAAAIKGGTGHVLAYPLQLPSAILKDLWETPHGRRYMVGFPAAILICIFLSRYNQKDKPHLRIGLFAAAAAVLVTVMKVLGVRSGISEMFITDLLVIGLMVLSFAVIFRGTAVILRRRPRHWDAREVLLLIPFGQLLSGAMTSAKTLPDFYTAIATTLLLVPIASPVRIRNVPQKTAYLALAAILGFGTIYLKIWKPYFWHNYRAGILFQDRQWYDHPIYGPMYIENEQVRFMVPICETIARDNGPKELLSLPYPYGNYFCGIPPWHGYVQTWFDTSGKATIDQLVHELNTAPPRWILYQRQLAVIKVHEKAFNDDKPLPHRALDKVIKDNLESGKWVAQDQDFQGADWFLIRTGK